MAELCFPQAQKLLHYMGFMCEHSSECALTDTSKDTIANKGEKLLPVREYKMDTNVCSQLCSRFIWGKKRKKGEWERTVVIVFYTKELALVTKQQTSNYIVL